MKTTGIDLGRRAVTVLLVVLCLLAVPAVATAMFTSAQSAGQTVGTGRMATPTDVTGRYTCFRNSSTEYVIVDVDSFSDAGPAGATYTYSLERSGAVVDSATTTARSARVSEHRANDDEATTWTLNVQPSIYQWTGGVATVTVECPRTSTKHGTF